MAELRYELQTNIGEVLNLIKTLQNRVDKLENEKHQINLDIDSKKLEKVITNLDKMLESLGKGTGDFKEFENLSKELSSIVSEVQNLSKAFGKVDDSGTKTLLSSIQNIDKSLSELSQHIINVNKNMSNIGGDTNNAVKQVENISNAYDNAAKNAEKLANAQNKIDTDKSLIDSSATVSEINKITQATKELNKTQTGSENIQSKSFTTKNKTEAYNQLKQTADVFKQFYGNEEATHTKAGTEAAYAYYKAYEEALKKRVAESKLQRVTVDIDPTDSFFTAEKLVYDRIQQYDNKLHYGGTSDLTEEITLLESRLSKFSEAYSKVKVNLGEAPITPNIIKNIEGYVRYIEIAEARAKDADLMGFTKDDIDDMKNLANMYLGFATEDAINENEKYITSLKEVKQEKENVDTSLSKSQISNMDSSLVEQQNKIQEELKETQKQAEQTIESLSKIGDGNKSNISSESVDNNNLKNKNQLINDIGKSYFDLLNKINSENSAIKEGNKFLGERIVLLKNNTIVDGYLGERKHVNGNFGTQNGDKIVHTHSEDISGESLSSSDMHSFVDNYLNNKVHEFELIWRNQILNIKLPNNLSENDLSYLSNSYEALYNAVVAQLGRGLENVPEDAATYFGKYVNSFLENILNNIGGSLTLSQIDTEGIIKQIELPKLNKEEYESIYSTLIRIKDVDFSSDYIKQIQDILSVTRPLVENVDTLYDSILYLYNLKDKSNISANIKHIMPFLEENDVKDLSNILSDNLTDIDLKALADAVYNQLYIPFKQSREEALSVINVIQEIGKLSNTASPIKDVFQGDNKATTDASTTAIKEESQALEQVSTSAKEAANFKEKFANANKEVKVSADASTPSVEEESDALDKVSKRSRSDADNIKLEQRARIYKELNSSLDRYAIVAGRVANGKTLSTDEEEMARLQVRIEELQNEPILSETQLELSRTKLEKIETSLENIQEKLQLKRIDSIQTSIDSYNKDYKSRVNGRPVEENRGKEYQQLLDKYKASIDALQAKKDELAKQPTISEADLDSVKKMTEAVEKNKNALIAMSAAEKGSTELSRAKEIDKINKYLTDNTRISEEAKIKLRSMISELENNGASVNLEKLHSEFLKVTNAERLAGNEGKRFIDVIKDKAWYGWAAQISSYFSLQDIIRYFKEGATVVKEFDDGLTNISYTMDVTKSQLDGIGQSVLDLSKDLKSSIDDSMQVAKIYANMNTTAEEIKKLSEPTLIMSNLTGFDASTMADDIQAVTQQFEIAAEDSMHIADVYDTVSKNIRVDYAKGIEAIAESVQVAGSTAKMAGLEFEDLAALTGKVVETTRLAGAQVGNGMKTIFTRLSRVGELSDEVDNETLSKASESLHQIGVEVYNADGSYRNFKTIMSELAAKWGSLTDAEKSNISFNIAA